MFLQNLKVYASKLNKLVCTTNISGQSATHPALAAEAHTEGVPPGYELVSQCHQTPRAFENTHLPSCPPPPPSLPPSLPAYPPHPHAGARLAAADVGADVSLLRGAAAVPGRGGGSVRLPHRPSPRPTSRPRGRRVPCLGKYDFRKEA